MVLPPAEFMDVPVDLHLICRTRNVQYVRSQSLKRFMVFYEL